MAKKLLINNRKEKKKLIKQETKRKNKERFKGITSKEKLQIIIFSVISIGIIFLMIFLHSNGYIGKSKANDEKTTTEQITTTIINIDELNKDNELYQLTKNLGNDLESNISIEYKIKDIITEDTYKYSSKYIQKSQLNGNDNLYYLNGTFNNTSMKYMLIKNTASTNYIKFINNNWEEVSDLFEFGTIDVKQFLLNISGYEYEKIKENTFEVIVTSDIFLNLVPVLTNIKTDVKITIIFNGNNVNITAINNRNTGDSSFYEEIYNIEKFNISINCKNGLTENIVVPEQFK